MKRWFLGVILTALGVQLAHAQEWGNFSREELFARHFPEAPQAEAVVLHDKATLRVEEDFALSLRRHVQVKVFHGEGRQEIRIPYRKGEEIKNLRAHTIVPPSRKSKVEKKHMRTEGTDGSPVLVIDFPDVTAGVILEYMFDKRSKQLSSIEPFALQGDWHVRSSKLSLQLPIGMKYDAFFGGRSRTPNPTEQVTFDPELPERQIQLVEWTFSNLEALASVPYAPALDESRLTLFLQLGAFTSASQKNFDAAQSWGDLGRNATAAHDQFLAKSEGASTWKAQNLPTIASGEAGARAIYELVERRISLRPEKALTSLSETLRSGEGNGIARALVAGWLLEASGYQATSVLVRTRDRGPLQDRFRCLSQFNQLLIEIAQPSGKSIFLDLASHGCPFGLVSPASHVKQGLWLSAEPRVASVNLPKIPSSRDFRTVAKLTPKGDLIARSRITFEGFEAVDALSGIKDFGQETFVESLLSTNLPGVHVREVKLVSEGSALPLVLDATYQVAGYSRIDGRDLVGEIPFGCVPLGTELPGGDRSVPIEFPYESTWDEVVKLTLPPGFSLVAEGAPRKTESMGALSFSTVRTSSDTQIEAKSRFQLTETRLPESRYGDLRAFQAALSAAQNEPFRIRRPAQSSAG